MADSLRITFSERVIRVLQALCDRGIKLGIVSNFDERLERTLLTHRLLHYFDFVVTTVSARSEKPDPAIFHTALDMAKVTHFSGRRLSKIFNLKLDAIDIGQLELPRKLCIEPYITLFTVILTYIPPGGRKPGGTTDRVITDSRYNGECY